MTCSLCGGARILNFLILALQLLRQTAELTRCAPSVKKALKVFNQALPHLTVMRDVVAHINDYAIDDGHHRQVNRQMIPNRMWDGTTFHWLDKSLNVDVAHDAAQA